MPTRRTLVLGLAGLGALGAAGATYGVAIEPRLRLAVAEYRLTPPNWPAGLRLSIAALADLHAEERHMPLARVETIVRATNALRPDVIVLLGDYRGSGRWTGRGIPIAETASVLRGLRAPFGVRAILGNHDWWDDAEVQRLRGGMPESHGILTDAGIGVLHNQAVRAGGMWIAGLGSLWAFREAGGWRGTHDLARATAAITDDAPAILLCHEPDIFPTVPPGRFALTLCGHTHGGQVRLLGRSPVVPSRYGNRYAYGHVVEDGEHLLVSGGLGVSVLPVRFGVPPEITLVHLGAA